MTTPLDAHRTLVHLACHNDGLLRAALEPIARSVQESDQRFQDATKNAAEDVVDFYVEEEAFVTDALLGAALVVCQAKLTAVASAVIQLAKYCTQKGIKTKVALLGTRPDLLGLGTKVGATGLSAARSVEVLANYFKHRDEWAGPWANLAGKSKATADACALLGLEEHRVFANLATGLVAVGIQPQRVDDLERVVHSWASEVENHVKSAF